MAQSTLVLREENGVKQSGSLVCLNYISSQDSRNWKKEKPDREGGILIKNKENISVISSNIIMKNLYFFVGLPNYNWNYIYKIVSVHSFRKVVHYKKKRHSP